MSHSAINAFRNWITWVFQTRKGNLFFCLTVLFGGSVFFLLLYFQRIHVAGILPACFFYKTTHIRCPGCGGTRAVEAILSGNVGGAFYYNALITGILAALLLYWVLMFLNALRREYRPLNIRFSGKTAMVLTILILVFFVIRNLPFYPLMR